MTTMHDAALANARYEVEQGRRVLLHLHALTRERSRLELALRHLSAWLFTPTDDAQGWQLAHEAFEARWEIEARTALEQARPAPIPSAEMGMVAAPRRAGEAHYGPWSVALAVYVLDILGKRTGEG